jgi:LPS sulfotransferase NodH
MPGVEYLPERHSIAVEPPPVASDGVTERALSYFVTGLPRTGSSMLVEALNDTRRLGVVDEYFWRLRQPAIAAQLAVREPGVDFENYFAAVLRHGTTSNGVFGAKLFWAHLTDLVSHLSEMDQFHDLSADQCFQAAFGPDIRFIRLVRNLTRVTISLWRADLTNAWIRIDGDPVPPPPADLDVWAVSRLHGELHGAEVGWNSFLALLGAPVLEVRYSAIVADVNRVVDQIGEFLHVPLATTAHVPRLRRQADATTERFIAEWVERTGGCAVCEPYID